LAVEIVENFEQWEQTFTKAWLAHYLKTGETKWDIYNRPNNTTLPTGAGVDPAGARIVLISSAGAYLPDTQEPYIDDDIGDYSTRRFSVTTPFEDIAFAHYHYDHNAVEDDPQVLLPLAHLADMVDEGLIGELAPDAISFNGYQPDVGQLLHDTIPAIIGMTKEMGATAALLVPS